jgi:hypothetical protein
MKPTASSIDIMPGHRMALMTGLAHTTGDLIFLSDCDLDEEPELMTQFHARFARVDWEVVFGFRGPGVAEERRAMAAGDVGPSYAKVGRHLSQSRI